MSTSIFSTYSTGENRVTASILAVLKFLSLGRVERLLDAPIVNDLESKSGRPSAFTQNQRYVSIEKLRHGVQS